MTTRAREGGEWRKTAEMEVPLGCGSVHRALIQCVKRAGDTMQKETLCRHLSRRLAECVISEACPEASEAVRVMCSSSGTSFKRKQCQEAKVRLSACLSFNASQTMIHDGRRC